MSRIPLPLRLYQMATHLVPLFAKRQIKNRMAVFKEHPTRWTERLGVPSQERPSGQLIWLHAVGLGEVLSLRGLITAMARDTDAHFLITSGTLAAANALANNMPPRALHQFLPLDAPRYRKAFLDHWQPDLCIWAEQDMWPGFVLENAKRGTPQALIVARMTDRSAEKKQRFAAAYKHLYGKMAHVTALDATTQKNLIFFGLPDVAVTGSIKPVAPPLSCDETERARLRSVLGKRFVWITAPSHPADEDLALSAHDALRQKRPDALLIIAPRYPRRTFAIEVPHAIRSEGTLPTTEHHVYLADTFGDLGLLYRLAEVALIGGTSDDNEGHSPWEAINLDTAILHGPRTANFAADYVSLDAAGAACPIRTSTEITDALLRDLTAQRKNAKAILADYHIKTDHLAQDLLRLI